MEIRKLLTFLLIMAVLAGCGGLPEEAKKSAEAIPDLIEKTSVSIKNKKGAFEVLQKSADWKFIDPYATNEKWIEKFSSAGNQIKRADGIYQKDIVPILERNEKEEVDTLYSNIRKVNQLLRGANQEANHPAQRKDFLLKAKREAPQWISKARSETAEIDELLGAAKAESEKAKINAKKYSWTKTDKDLDSVFGPLKVEADKACGALQTAEVEMKKVSSGKADYAKLGDSVTTVSVLLQSMKKKQPAFLKETDGLYRNYSKTLEDMRIEYHIQIRRLSWDNFYDFPTEHPYDFIRKVDESVYEYFEEFPDGNVAHVGGWGGAKVLVSNTAMWSALKITDLKENWPRGDDEADLWVEKTFTKTFHKYSVVENEKESETDWVLVSENFYWAHEEHLGMTIISKPYGVYEEEIIKDATPKGMGMIAAPKMVDGKPIGKNKHGEWRTDNQGHSFWHYYGMYHFLFGGNRYSYNDWSGYRNRDGSYHGSRDQHGTWGSSTFREGSRYGNSHYAKRNPGTVREARDSKIKQTARGKSVSRPQTASVRGAGKDSRGRGASGRGGK